MPMPGSTGSLSGKKMTGPKLAAEPCPSRAERDELLKGFARALFKGDMAALYSVVTADFRWNFHDGLVVTKSLAGPAAIAAHLAEQKALFSAQRFHDVAYHHADEMTFMTFRVSETVRATGEQREQRGIESYTFANGRLASKDVYRKPVML
jgi:ketosteroid isomerase-like protein